MEDPAPVLRAPKVPGAPACALVEERSGLLAQRAAAALALSEADVRGPLNRLLDQILASSADSDVEDKARQALRG